MNDPGYKRPKEKWGDFDQQFESKRLLYSSFTLAQRGIQPSDRTHILIHSFKTLQHGREHNRQRHNITTHVVSLQKYKASFHVTAWHNPTAACSLKTRSGCKLQGRVTSTVSVLHLAFQLTPTMGNHLPPNWGAMKPPAAHCSTRAGSLTKEIPHNTNIKNTDGLL